MMKNRAGQIFGLLMAGKRTKNNDSEEKEKL